MKIATSHLQMASSHTSLQQQETRQSLKMWIGQQRPDFEGRGPRRLPANPPANDNVKLSESGKAAQSAEAVDQELNAAVDKDPRLNLLRRMLEFLTGGKIRVFDPQELDSHSTSAQPATITANAASPAPPTPAGYGVEYDYHSSYTELEQTTFSASGTVTTADGRNISFQLDLSMTRQYHEESDVSLRFGDAPLKTDPLVLNFAGTAAQLNDQRFAFDLNADGKTEQINTLGQGSGFLVFDRNGDGKINDGRELFGPTSGDGFAELRKLDDDGNDWIDENDAAYRQLQVWRGNSDGKNQLQSLAAANVGAIALTPVNTPFSVKNNSNQLLGEVRSSGVFLQDDGKAGTIQQIDLTV